MFDRIIDFNNNCNYLHTKLSISFSCMWSYQTFQAYLLHVFTRNHQFSYPILLVQLALNFLNVIHNPIFLEIKYIFGSVTSFIFIQIKFCQ